MAKFVVVCAHEHFGLPQTINHRMVVLFIYQSNWIRFCRKSPSYNYFSLQITLYRQTWQMPPLFFTEKSPLCCIACYYVLYEHVIFKFWLCNFTLLHAQLCTYWCFRLHFIHVLCHFCFVCDQNFWSKNLLQPPAMATIMKRGVKRRLAELSQREDKLKLKRQVYEEIEKLKSQNKNRGIFAIVARQLVLTRFAITTRPNKSWSNAEVVRLKNTSIWAEENRPQ